MLPNADEPTLVRLRPDAIRSMALPCDEEEEEEACSSAFTHHSAQARLSSVVGPLSVQQLVIVEKHSRQPLALQQLRWQPGKCLHNALRGGTQDSSSMATHAGNGSAE